MLAWNERVIDRAVPKPSGTLDPADFPWTSAIADAWPSIQAEYDALERDRVRLPDTSAVAGFDQGNEGRWSTFVLYTYGAWLEQNCERCPTTASLIRDLPGLHVAGFSVLGPHSHLPMHRGFNRGALRFQVGIRVPGRPGDNRIQVGDTLHVWREGGTMMFDHSVEHEAWNDSDGERAVLFIELRWPLPGRAGITNGLTQKVFGLAARGIPRRVQELEDQMNG